jgi:sugar lactone lactonase YvrE
VFAAPPVIRTEVFARVPDSLRARENPRQQSGVPRDSFLEGPSFDRDGNLYVVNIPYGQVFRVSPQGEFAVVATWDGEAQRSQDPQRRQNIHCRSQPRADAARSGVWQGRNLSRSAAARTV